MAEQRSFVLAVVFIIAFAGLIQTVPIDFQGQEETPETLTPIDPTILADFADAENFTKDTCTTVGTISIHTYQLPASTGDHWYFQSNPTGYDYLMAKKIFWSGLWFGEIDKSEFIAPDSINRGTHLTRTELEEDAVNGTVAYSLISSRTGDTHGTFIFYWNYTLYGSNSLTAWNAEELYLLHGVGVDDTGVINIGMLLIQLMTFSLPDVPFLINLILISPLVVSFGFIIWYIIKETTPFL